MPTVSLHDSSGAKIGELALSGVLYEAERSIPLMHQAVVVEESHQRLGTHSTKGRSEVRGGEQEIAAARTIHPRGTEDQMAAAADGDCTLARQLAGAVDVEWVAWIVFAPWCSTAAVEYIIG